MDSFKKLLKKENLITGLEKDGITVPTQVQIDTLPIALEHKDLIVEAVTGSGKTLAYILPVFEKVDPLSRDLYMIVLAPTHELVVQINNSIKTLATNSGIAIRSTTVIGEVNINRQIESLKLKPHIIVGTPGRVLELIQMKKLKSHQAKAIVLDEGDKLLSDFNIDAVKAIVKTTLKERQLSMYSASIGAVASQRAQEMMKTPHLFNLTAEKVNSDIEHLCIIADSRDKIDTLRRVIHAENPTRAIVFINKNEMIQEVVSKLAYHKVKAVGIFGNATKADRKDALDAFRSGKAKILVASDLVARGLDLKDISHVISLDVPPVLSDYVHRAGRTGRAGKKGKAISIITEGEIKVLLKIEKDNDIVFKPKVLYKEKLIDQE